MDGIIPPLRRAEKRRLKKRLRKCRDPLLANRIRIVLKLDEGCPVTTIADVLCVSRTTVYRVADRYRMGGEDGLEDRRRNNGTQKIDGAFLSVLMTVVRSCPADHGWKRPTWTREMIVTTMARKTKVRVHVSTLSHALHRIGARRGRPKPVVGCPWPERRKNRRLKQLQELVDNLPDDEVVVYEDEVDIHLNPKIGLDWMLPGQQKQVLTPGKNCKRYLAGCYNPNTQELLYVEGEKKNAILFIEMLWKLVTHYPEASVIHVILDNYGIHETAEVHRSLAAEAGQRIRLHFLPPYCPDHNRIERVWQDLHANVTRNHRCACMTHLMKNVRRWMDQRQRQATMAA